MRRWLLAFFLIALPAFAQDDLGPKIDAIFASYAKSDSPGCVVGVSRGANAIFQRGYGMANLEHDVPLTPSTILEAGSVSKQFTAAAIMMLAADGKLSIDDPVRKYLPELDQSANAITIRELLSHTSGLRDWGAIVSVAGWPRGSRRITHANVLDIMSRQRELNAPPDTVWSYNTGAYNLLAIIVERVSGKSFPDFTRERIFAPLGMTHSSWRDDYTRVVKGRATAYDFEGGAFHSDMDVENIYGNCCLLTTVGDLLAWNIKGADMQKPLEMPSKLASGITTEYGFGLFIRDNEIWHSGATAGYRAFLTHFINEDVSIALLCNRGDAATASLVTKVAEAVGIRVAAADSAAAVARGRATPHGLYVDRKTNAIIRVTEKNEGNPNLRMEDDGLHLVTHVKPETVYVKVDEVKPTPEQLAEYAHTYVSDEAAAAWVISVVNGKLVVKLQPSVMVTLEPTYKDAFTDDDGDLVNFTRDANGRIDGLDTKAEVSMLTGTARLERMHFKLHP